MWRRMGSLTVVGSRAHLPGDVFESCRRARVSPFGGETVKLAIRALM